MGSRNIVEEAMLALPSEMPPCTRKSILVTAGDLSLPLFTVWTDLRRIPFQWEGREVWSLSVSISGPCIQALPVTQSRRSR